MANITRIKNNQITDSTITYAKIASGTLVGSVFNANLTLNSNVTVIGNLSVTGNTTTVNSTNTYVNDPLIVFNNGYVGSPSYDIGMIANRNLQTLTGYGSVNTAFVWREADAAFEALATTETGSTTGSINVTGWANLKVGNATAISGNIYGTTAATSSSTGALIVSGGVGIAGAIYTAGLGQHGAGLQNTIIGNATASSATFTTATTGGLQAVAIGNVTPGTGAFTTLSATGASTLNTVTAASLQGVIGNVTPAAGTFTTLTATTLSLAAINGTVIGNVTPAAGTFTTLTAQTETVEIGRAHV